MDAGIATMFAASVVEFSHFGMGGEAPILVRTKDGKVYAIAGVGTMPKLATADFFRNHKLKPDEIVDPPEAEGPEGLGAGGRHPDARWCPAWWKPALVTLREFGTKSFAEAVQPAIELADGFPLDELRANHPGEQRAVSAKHGPPRRSVFLPNGRSPQPGEIFRQPDLARTLRVHGRRGEEGAGRGRQPQPRPSTPSAITSIAATSLTASTQFSKANDGLLRYEDMAAFQLEPEEPVSTTFHGYTVYKPGFWSQGPTMIEALNILEGFDLARLRLNSADYIHTLVEALKLAYADRDTYYGDPKFMKIPTERLLSQGVCRRAAQADRRTRPRSISVPADVEANPPKHPFYVGHRALQDRRRAAGQGHHLRGRHRQRRHRDFDHAFGRVAALGDRGRYRDSADRARAELPAGARASQRTGAAASGRA